MTDEELKLAEQTLLKLEQELTHYLADKEGTNEGPKMDSAVGRLSFIDAFQQHQMGLHGRRNLQMKLERVRSALARIRNGVYGKCVECERDIAPERLEFAPEVPFCIKCQEKFS